MLIFRAYAGQVNPFVENWDHICLTDVVGSPIFGKRSTGDRPRQSGDNTRQVTISTEGPTAGDNPWTDLPPPKLAVLASLFDRNLRCGNVTLIRSTHHSLLFIGDAINARDLRQLYDREVAAVVDLAANEPPAQLGRDLIYCRFPLHDDGSNSPHLLRAAIDCVRSLLLNDVRLLVACSAGMSRSPVVASAAVSLLTGASLDDSLSTIVQDSPHDVSPAFLSSVAEIHATMLGADVSQAGD
ncbi:dual specificity protein phosphatase family protein [Allorhodopirellula heiligendammensis]|uniref:dual specificity protein phosphatase family protein n=1 Tax=Allorhodopirellula heiligendammensis TaxID=2714739 RepID=UPI0011B71CF0|nr:dual specificity protein phosphatase [Allorhodopirellula heiligendammensis]